MSWQVDAYFISIFHWISSLWPFIFFHCAHSTCHHWWDGGLWPIVHWRKTEALIVEKGGEDKADHVATKAKISKYMSVYWGSESVHHTWRLYNQACVLLLFDCFGVFWIWQVAKILAGFASGFLMAVLRSALYCIQVTSDRHLFFCCFCCCWANLILLWLLEMIIILVSGVYSQSTGFSQLCYASWHSFCLKNNIMNATPFSSNGTFCGAMWRNPSSGSRPCLCLCGQQLHLHNRLTFFFSPMILDSDR